MVSSCFDQDLHRFGGTSRFHDFADRSAITRIHNEIVLEQKEKKEKKKNISHRNNRLFLHCLFSFETRLCRLGRRGNVSIDSTGSYLRSLNLCDRRGTESIRVESVRVFPPFYFSSWVLSRVKVVRETTRGYLRALRLLVIDLLVIAETFVQSLRFNARDDSYKFRGLLVDHYIMRRLEEFPRIIRIAT